MNAAVRVPPASIASSTITPPAGEIEVAPAVPVSVTVQIAPFGIGPMAAEVRPAAFDSVIPVRVNTDPAVPSSVQFTEYVNVPVPKASAASPARVLTIWTLPKAKSLVTVWEPVVPFPTVTPRACVGLYVTVGAGWAGVPLG